MQVEPTTTTTTITHRLSLPCTCAAFSLLRGFHRRRVPTWLPGIYRSCHASVEPPATRYYYCC